MSEAKQSLEFKLGSFMKRMQLELGSRVSNYFPFLDLGIYFVDFMDLKITSLNVCGIRAPEKLSKIRNLIKSEGCNFLGIQESKCEVIDDPIIRRMWGNDQFDFVFKKSMGASGFDCGLELLHFQERGRNFCGVGGSWLGVEKKIGFLNIYGPHSKPEKDALWEDLENLIALQDLIWVLFGDFNSVRSADERFGSCFDAQDAARFNTFISCAGLHDIQFAGRRFTRFNKQGTKMSKLDRFLVSSNFFNQWKDATVYALPRTISDHCPILLKVGKLDYGPNPFKIFDHVSNYVQKLTNQ
ncbi:hypothetical protein OSB04_022417 [Centaurea solstitialis]|uniref:Endonuclease/exonuclease/phosphatase domain-containing protein n=1 Tax=Centaurea solstitialis TaxID=347529 RepID=A0AA38WH85_9ASTR|nr:hypothetical protein OSB04_022417 [Centaurea solstitialis]